jgi:hypothetical protein
LKAGAAIVPPAPSSTSTFDIFKDDNTVKLSTAPSRRALSAIEIMSKMGFETGKGLAKFGKSMDALVAAKKGPSGEEVSARVRALGIQLESDSGSDDDEEEVS